ncbi:MAG: 16S rRNA (adenine(1518)-N(6)/adenine(1519)-N(6))-dimethyltransferase RsmA [Porticoccaceae bacterium]|nr:16S rRNA (adenine(1518)-N(6)/adenine(1519)-N(6))-dimethyltransferase RsmA [Porticoccaceae bacterium]
MKTTTPEQPRHRARKRFGQNFLVDTHVINNIVAAINVKPDDHVVEIGPGLGALTDALIKAGRHLSVIEIDRDLAQRLNQRYASEKHFSLHRSDALKTDFAEIASGQTMRIVGNLPYNISTPLLFHLLRYRTSISDMYFMLQKEVVDRLAAPPGNKNYGRLSVMMQYHCQIQALFTVPPTAFNPAPKVTSAVVRLIPHIDPPHRVIDMQLFERVVKTCFQQRRKTLRNSLKVLTDGMIELPDSDIDLGARPETLSVAEFVALSNLLSKTM